MTVQKLVLASFVFIFILIGGVFFAVASRVAHTTCLNGTVAQIGGCDKYGQCATLLSNGVGGVSQFPLVGKPAKVCFQKD